MGVTSRISEIFRPAAASARRADSRPAPGPFTITVTFFRPCSIALAAASPAATWAANGVDFRLPLKPRAPAEDQEMTFPETSVMVMMVLLKVLWMCTTPLRMFFLPFLLTRFSAVPGATGAAAASAAGAAAGGVTSSAIRVSRQSWKGLRPGRRGGGGLGPDDSPLGALPGAGVRVGALAADGETLPMAQAAVAAEVHQPLDVHRDLATEITLDLVIRLDDLADGPGLLLGEVLGPGGQVDARLGHDVLGGLVSDPVDVLQGDHHPLGGGKVDAGDASHAGSGSSFPWPGP